MHEQDKIRQDKKEKIITIDILSSGTLNISYIRMTIATDICV